MATGQHLTQEQIAAWMLGERPSETIQHLRSCSACEAEVLLLGTTLLDFRGAVREWSRENTTSTVMPAPTVLHHPLFTFNRACLTMAVAIVCVLLAIILRPQRSADPSTNAISDRALMTQVDDQISRTVPTAMDPLLQLVAWQSDGHMDAGEAIAEGRLGKGTTPGAAN
jgi:hypothetical protein